MFINTYLKNYLADCLEIWYIKSCMYVEDIKHINLIEISPVFIEIQGVENGNLVVPLHNTFMCHMSFLATDTQVCVLIMVRVWLSVC